MLLRLDCLMQTVGVTASRHNTSGKFVYNQYLVVLYHIILVAEHQVMGTERQNDIMLDFQILRVSIVVNMEELFYLLDTRFRQVNNLVLFVDNKVTVLFLYHAHDGIHLCQLLHIIATLHPSCQQITHLIKSR